MFDELSAPMMPVEHIPAISLMLQMRTVAELDTIRNLLCDLLVIQRSSTDLKSTYPVDLESQINFAQKTMNDVYGGLWANFYKKFGA